MNTPAYPSGEIHKRRVNPNDPGSDFAVMAKTEPLHKGMELRDWFAGVALSGMLADPATGIHSAERFAELSYALADAMLAERNKEVSNVE